MTIPFLRKNNEVLIPLLGSIALHIAALAVTLWLALPKDYQAPENQNLNFIVRSVETNPLAKPGPAGSGRVMQKAGSFSAAELLRNAVFHSEGPADLKTREKAPEVIARRGRLGIPGGKTDVETLMMSTQETRFKEKVGPVAVKVSETADAVRMAHTHQITQDKFYAAVKGPVDRFGTGATGSVGMDMQEGMPGFTPVAGGVNAGIGNADVGAGLSDGGAGGHLRKYDTIDDFLDIEVTTYERPADSQKYFMVKIFAKKDLKVFKIMPKEILFAVDCSLSISPDRLEEFKKGVRYCLEHLGPDDVFNVVSFKEKAEYFAPKSVKATAQTIKDAERYILNLTSDQRTNVYSAFKAIVESPLGRVPSDVMLLSDGRPTFGVVDSRELINSITRTNRSVRPVFVFSGGARVNRYLLDFIAYQNRGWSQFTKSRGDIAKGLAGFYDKIRDPIFLNLRFQLQGLDEKEVYPKSLPDFYRNAEFVLYGTYQKQDRFSMRLLGDVDGKTKELIFTRVLSEAPKGTDAIMRGWAFNKVYYLISQMIGRPGQDPKMLSDIRELSRRYEVTTPYSPELEKLD
ncbi:MAG: hypothetical protein WCG06_02655 [Candidatus Omnitrophota bacterium]